MTLQELDTMMEDTRRAARIEDRAAFNMALAVMEIARQLIMLNEKLGGSAQNVQTIHKVTKKR